MPYVPGFEYDLFISYASGDNHQGTVEEFVATLRDHISDNLVNCFSPKEKIRIYLDRERLASQTAVNWDEHLKAAISSTALLVPLLSPNYLSTPYCNKELDWFRTQPHVKGTFPFAVAGWLPVGKNPVPKDLAKAQRHPAGESWLGLLPPDERTKSVKEFALKLRDALVTMRASVSAVFLGPAAGRGLATRSRLRDELEESGYRVVPHVDYEFRDKDGVQAHLKAALLAVHFPGDGLDIEGLTAMKESFLSARKTLLIRPFGSKLEDDESDQLAEIDEQLGSEGRYARVAHARIEGKTDDQVWDTVKREVGAARYQNNKSEFKVGVACEARDIAGAKTVAGLISGAGVPAQYPSFDTAASTTEKLEALRNIVTQSPALLCYWAAAGGRGLERRLEQDARCQYKAKAWYLAPPLDMPGKEKLSRLAHQGDVRVVAFSPDGKWVATGSDDKTARVMEAATGNELHRIELPGPTRAVRFSHDGRWLEILHSNSTGNDLIYARHPLDPQELIREACEKVTRNLTVAEWKQYVGPEIPYRRTGENRPFPPDQAAGR